MLLPPGTEALVKGQESVLEHLWTSGGLLPPAQWLEGHQTHGGPSWVKEEQGLSHLTGQNEEDREGN